MKNLFVIFFALIMSSNVMGQNVYSEAGNDLRKKDYKSFTINDNDNKTMFDKDKINLAIKHEMIGLNYDLKAENPDLLVSYNIYEKKGKINGNFRQSADNSNNTSRQILEVKKGTLLISIIDTKSGENVWTGISDGVFEGKQEASEAEIIRAVHNIFNQFGL